MSRLAAIALVGALVLACDPTPAPEDAAPPMDAGRDAAQRDSGRCDLECAAGRACCNTEEGAMCVDLATDVDNCGTCGRDCVALRRGDVCVDFQCSCGAAEVGCTGMENSICCPPVVEGGQSYCANLGRDPTDCGSCGFVCPAGRSSRCEGGSCMCGTSGDLCAGTPEDFCCTRDAEDYSCVDTTSSMDHCGFCGHRCNAFEICREGECVSTLPDAGLVDAGLVDAGLVDAGLVDAGLDAGVDALP